VDVEELVRKVLEARERVASRVPDIDPGDLFHILEMVFRPFGSGLSFFQRELRPGCHVL
jgi:hypothetical protein